MIVSRRSPTDFLYTEYIYLVGNSFITIDKWGITWYNTNINVRGEIFWERLLF